MTERPIFIPTENFPFVVSKDVQFTWFCGLSKTQKQKCIRSLHKEAIGNQTDVYRILEISTKSEIELGTLLSAFNLKIQLDNLEETTVEGLYQSAKVFQRCGPHPEWRNLKGKDIKKELKRLVEEGIKGKNEIHRAFELNGKYWRNLPLDLFFDWIYFNAVFQLVQTNPTILEDLFEYDAFTDINFNPKKGINCQAKSLSKYVALAKKGIPIEGLLSCPSTFSKKLFHTTSYYFAEVK